MQNKIKFTIILAVATLLVWVYGFVVAQTGEGSITITSSWTKNSPTMDKLVFQLKCLSGSRIDCERVDFSYNNNKGWPVLQDGTISPSSQVGQYISVWSNMFRYWDSKQFAYVNTNSRQISFLILSSSTSTAQLSYFDRAAGQVVKQNIVIPSSVSLPSASAENSGSSAAQGATGGDYFECYKGVKIYYSIFTPKIGDGGDGELISAINCSPPLEIDINGAKAYWYDFKAYPASNPTKLQRVSRCEYNYGEMPQYMPLQTIKESIDKLLDAKQYGPTGFWAYYILDPKQCQEGQAPTPPAAQEPPAGETPPTGGTSAFAYCPDNMGQICIPAIQQYASQAECEANLELLMPPAAKGAKCYKMEDMQACITECATLGKQATSTAPIEGDPSTCAREGEKVGQCQARRCCDGLIPRPPIGNVCFACDVCEAFTCVSPDNVGYGNTKAWYCDESGDGGCKLSGETFADMKDCQARFGTKLCFPNISGSEKQMQGECDKSCTSLVNGSLTVRPYITTDASCNKIINFDLDCAEGKKISCSNIDLQYQYSSGAENYVNSNPAAERFDYGFTNGGIVYSWIWRNIKVEAGQTAKYILTMRPGSYSGAYGAKIFYYDPSSGQRLSVSLNLPYVEKCQTGDGGTIIINPGEGGGKGIEASCGNASCEAFMGENLLTCPQDCQPCNNDSLCQVERGESVDNCSDCAQPPENKEFTIATKPASDIAADRMTLNGELSGLGSYSSVDYALEYYPCDYPEMISQSPTKVATEPIVFSYDLIGLPQDTEYCFKAIARASGASDIIQGDLLRAKTLAASSSLSCPTPIYPGVDENIESLSPQLRWSSPSGVNYFQYALYQDAIDGAPLKEGDGALPQANVGPLVWGKHYYWRVNACRDATLRDCSNWCPAWHFITGMILGRPNITAPSSSDITDTKPMLAWDFVSGAQYYEYILEQNGTEIERKTISTNQAYPTNELPYDNYTLRVRACRDQQKQNCGPYSVLDFAIKDAQTILTECSTVRIGSKKFFLGDQNFAYLDKCSSGDCPSPYRQPNIDLKATYVVNPEYTIYLLDEKRNIKYESGSPDPIPQGQTLKLVIEPLSLPITNFGNGGYSNSGGQTIKFLDDALKSFEGNEELPTQEALDDNGISFNVGVGADNPVNLPGFQYLYNEYFQPVQKDGGIYLKAVKPTVGELDPDAKIDVSVPRLNSYQTADNIYLNKGCILANEPQHLGFYIKAVEQLSVSHQYEGRGYVKINVSPAKSGLEYSMKCFASNNLGQRIDLSVSQQSEPSRFLVSVASGVKVEGMITCEYIVTDTSNNVDYLGTLTIDPKDISAEQPAPPILGDITIDYCQYPAVVNIPWQSPSPQSGYSLDITCDNGSAYSERKDKYAVGLALVPVSNDDPDALKFSGTCNAKVIVIGESGLPSSESEKSFTIARRSAFKPIISEVERVPTRFVRYQGSAQPPPGYDGLIPGSGDWEWIADPSVGKTTDNIIYEVPIGSAENLKLTLKIYDRDIPTTCSYTTTTGVSNKVEFTNTEVGY